MLARSFKSAADLGLREVEYNALITVLGMLERAELDHRFKMTMWLCEAGSDDCQTTGCIAGWAYMVSGRRAFKGVEGGGGPMGVRNNKNLWALLHPDFKVAAYATAKSGAVALANYLTTGEPDWDAAMLIDS